MDDGTLPQCLLGASLEDEVVSGPPGMVEWVEGKGRIKLDCGVQSLWNLKLLEFLSGLLHLFTRITMGTCSLSLRFGWLFCYFCL